jgi:phytoene synthase
MNFLHSAADYCRKLTARSQSNFYYAFLFLPKERRQALEAIYAYCRLVDDVVDEDAPIAQKLAGLNQWQQNLEVVFSQQPSNDPVLSQLKDAVSRFAIRREDMEGIIDGCAMDVEQSRYENWDQLRTYCYRVASCVGLMCIEIFGFSSPKAREYAIDLGIALQLTNILRDVAEDAQRGRIYLPADEMRAFGVSDEDLLEGRRTPELQRLMAMNAQRARVHYLRARAALSPYARRQLVIGEIMGDIYYALLERLEESRFDVFGDKLKVGRRQKMAIALRNFAQAKLGNFAEGMI